MNRQNSLLTVAGTVLAGLMLGLGLLYASPNDRLFKGRFTPTNSVAQGGGVYRVTGTFFSGNGSLDSSPAGIQVGNVVILDGTNSSTSPYSSQRYTVTNIVSTSATGAVLDLLSARVPPLDPTEILDVPGIIGKTSSAAGMVAVPASAIDVFPRQLETFAGNLDKFDRIAAITGGGAGNVTGAASSTPLTLALATGTTGKAIAFSGLTVSTATNSLTIPGTVAASVFSGSVAALNQISATNAFEIDAARILLDAGIGTSSPNVVRAHLVNATSPLASLPGGDYNPQYRKLILSHNVVQDAEGQVYDTQTPIVSNASTPLLGTHRMAMEYEYAAPLINLPGAGWQNISSIGTGATPTVTTADPHNYVSGDTVQFRGLTGGDAALLNAPLAGGADSERMDFIFAITVTGASTFTVSGVTISSAITGFGSCRNIIHSNEWWVELNGRRLLFLVNQRERPDTASSFAVNTPFAVYVPAAANASPGCTLSNDAAGEQLRLTRTAANNDGYMSQRFLSVVNSGSTNAANAVNWSITGDINQTGSNSLTFRNVTSAANAISFNPDTTISILGGISGTVAQTYNATGAGYNAALDILADDGSSGGFVSAVRGRSTGAGGTGGSFTGDGTGLRAYRTGVASGAGEFSMGIFGSSPLSNPGAYSDHLQIGVSHTASVATSVALNTGNLPLYFSVQGGSSNYQLGSASAFLPPVEINGGLTLSGSAAINGGGITTTSATLGLNKPLKLASYTTGGLPASTIAAGIIVANTTTGTPYYSDGIAWRDLGSAASTISYGHMHASGSTEAQTINTLELLGGAGGLPWTLGNQAGGITLANDNSMVVPIAGTYSVQWDASFAGSADDFFLFIPSVNGGNAASGVAYQWTKADTAGATTRAPSEHVSGTTILQLSANSTVGVNVANGTATTAIYVKRANMSLLRLGP